MLFLFSPSVKQRTHTHTLNTSGIFSHSSMLYNKVLVSFRYFFMHVLRIRRISSWYSCWRLMRYKLTHTHLALGAQCTCKASAALSLQISLLFNESLSKMLVNWKLPSAYFEAFRLVRRLKWTKQTPRNQQTAFWVFQHKYFDFIQKTFNYLPPYRCLQIH